MEYYVGVAGRQEGPFPEAEVRQRVAHGTLGGDDLCWTEGWPDWRKVKDAFPDAFLLRMPPAVAALPVAPATTDGIDEGGEGPPAAVSSSRPAAAAEVPSVSLQTPAADAPGGPAASPLPPPPPPVVASQTSTMAVWSLVLALVGCLFGLPSIVLGHLARSEIKQAAGRISGGGLALAGLILGYVELIALPVLFAWWFVAGWGSTDYEERAEKVPAPAVASNTAAYDVSQGNLRQIAQACLIHALRHGGRFPDDVAEIRDAFGAQFEAVMDLPHTDEVETRGYVIVPGVTTSRPSSTIIAFETRPRSDGMRAVAFVNGTVTLVDEDDVPYGIELFDE